MLIKWCFVRCNNTINKTKRQIKHHKKKKRISENRLSVWNLFLMKIYQFILLNFVAVWWNIQSIDFSIHFEFVFCPAYTFCCCCSFIGWNFYSETSYHCVCTFSQFIVLVINQLFCNTFYRRNKKKNIKEYAPHTSYRFTTHKNKFFR